MRSSYLFMPGSGWKGESEAIDSSLVVSVWISVKLSNPLKDVCLASSLSRSIQLPDVSIDVSGCVTSLTSCSVNISWFISKQLFLTLLISASILSITFNVDHPQPSLSVTSKLKSDASLSIEQSRIKRLTSLTSIPEVNESTELFHLLFPKEPTWVNQTSRCINKTAPCYWKDRLKIWYGRKHQGILWYQKICLQRDKAWNMAISSKIRKWFKVWDCLRTLIESQKNQKASHNILDIRRTVYDLTVIYKELQKKLFKMLHLVKKFEKKNNAIGSRIFKNH